MANPKQIAEVQVIVTPEDFVSMRHRIIYEAILKTQGTQEVGLIGVWSQLRRDGNGEKVGGCDYLEKLVVGTPDTCAATHYAKKIERYSRGRKVGKVCGDVQKQLGLAEDLGEEDLARWCGSMIRELTGAGTSETVHRNSEILAKIDLAGLPALIEGDPKTGLIAFDSSANLFEVGALTIIGARPGMGKTTLMRKLIRINAPHTDTLVFTFEESEVMLMQKLICEEASIPYTRYIRNRTSDQEKSRLMEVMGKVAEWKLYTAERSMSPDEVATNARRVAAIEGRSPRLIFIDHFSHMRHERVRGENDATCFGRGALALANLAKEMKSTVVLLCQLNREVESREEPRPYLSDLRDTGALEQLAQNILFLWSEDITDQTRFAYLAKQRNGPTFEAKLTFLGEYGRFENYAEDRDGARNGKADY